MLTDPISDMITRVRNAIMAGHKHVKVPYSNIKKEIVRVLFEEGYIGNFREIDENEKEQIEVTLKYINEESPIHEMKRISKPSRRVYVGKDEIPLVKRGFGISILSTSSGVKSDGTAREEGVGGELLIQVW